MKNYISHYQKNLSNKLNAFENTNSCNHKKFTNEHMENYKSFPNVKLFSEASKKEVA